MLDTSQSWRQEYCAQEDARLASYAAQLARSADTAGIGESREEYDVIAGFSLDYRDVVERLLEHQAVAHVAKLLKTDEALGA